MTNITQTTAATYGGAAVGKVLGRLGCGGDMHFTPAECAAFNPPVTIEIKVGAELAAQVNITGFDLRREQVGTNGDTRLLLIANEV